jgi:hypothetical protein
MGEIEMLGGSDMHLDHGKEDGAAQKTGGGGDIQMYGGSDMHLSHGAIGSEQKGKGSGGLDMVGMQGLINKGQRISPYGQDKPDDHGKE